MEGFRLSPQQERIWLLQCAGGGAAAFAAQCVVRVDGEAGDEALRAAVESVAARHEILRTELLAVPGLKRPLQVIGGRSPAWGDLVGLQGEAKTLDRILEEERDLLADGTLLRVRPAVGRQGERLLLFTVAAHCTDAAGLENLLREVAAAYGGALEEEAPPVPYASIADWLNELLEAPEAEPGRQHWRRQDFGRLARMRLPLADGPADGTAFCPQRVPVRLPAAAAERIAGLAGAHGISPAALLLAVWQALLQRVTGEAPVIVGAVAEGRTDPDLEASLGPLARALPLESRVRADLSLLEGARLGQQSLDEGTDWQECFGGRIAAEAGAGPEEELRFAFGFVWDRPLGRHAAAGAEFSMLERRAHPDRFSAQLRCRLEGGIAAVDLVCDSAAIPAEEAERMAARLSALLEAALSRPESRLADLDCLGREERSLLLQGLQGRSARYPSELCLHQLVELQVDRTPDAVAVAAEDGELTYRELDRRANRLAHRLRSLGVGPDVPVAMVLDRSFELVVALLGILKAGGAYVPIDPGSPPQRIAALLESCAAPVVLTGSALAGRLPDDGARRLLLDEESAALRDDRPESGVAGENLAYVLYTSGSTGVPKGAMVTHATVCNHMWWMQEDYPLGIEDRVLQKTPYVFDASVWEIFSPLIAGARLVLARPGGHRDSAYLVEALIRHGVTILQVVPALLRLLVSEPGLDRCVRLRRIYAGGEPLTGELAEALAGRLACELVNLYGPTETTIQVTTWAHAGAEANVPIGRPIANAKLYVLDPELRLLPLGTTGELFIGGVPPGRGYLGRPDLTAARFVPDPIGGVPGARLYATGDLARWRADGALGYHGRLDHQVKVRGFRVELGEIESALRRSPAVREAVVVAAGEGGAAERLVAYVVPAAGAEPSARELRALLESLLPDYMVPAAFVMLEDVPLLPSGKVDRRALPDPAEDGPAAMTPPRTVTEELVAAIWSDLLGREQIGVEENFFDLGGHSLVATRIIARVRQALDVEVPLQSLFRFPTVAGFTREVEKARGRLAVETPPLLPRQRGPEAPPSFAQQRLWLIDQLQPGNPAYNIAVALLLEGPLDPRLLARALAEVVRRHESLRTTFSLRDVDPVQVIAPAAGLDLPLVDLSALDERRAAELALALALENALLPFDLSKGPLVRILLAHLGSGRHALFLAVHHIVGDGASLEVLVREATALYQGFSSGQGPPLPDLPVQYADFAVWQREWLSGEVLAGHLAYWRERLAGVPPSLDLPFDRPRPPVQTFAGASRSFALGGALSSAVAAASRRQGVTAYMLLLAAYGVLLSRFSGQTDFAIGTPVSGRNRVELEGLIGFLVNTLVMRIDLAADQGFDRWLREVRTTVLDAHAHQDLPFERLVEEIEVERRLEHSPVFQVLINHGVAPSWPELPGLAIRPFAGEGRTAQFDLTLGITQARDTLHGALQYNTDLFDVATAARLVRGFEALLAAACVEPEARVSELPLLSDAERHHLLREWNDTVTARLQVCSVDALIAEQAARAPDTVAVVAGSESLSYGELDRLARCLAAELVRIGVRPESRVGVLLDRSAALPVALLGIWKAGGAYVPLDPAYPNERLAYMLEDSQAVALVAAGDLAAAVPGWTKPVVRLDGSGIAAAPAAPLPSSGPPPESLAYVIYTSGSTGRPKGVGISHSALANFLLSMAERPGLAAGDRMLAVTSPSFDIAGLELFLPLLVGARVVIAAREAVLDGERLLADWDRFGATVLQATPGTWRALADAGWPGSGSGLALCGGEAMPPDLARTLAARATETWNLYGPTETTVWSAVWRLDGPIERTVPLGRPIANTEIYVLDDGLRAVPLGAFGELLIGGEGVARGYLDRPRLTAERFVPDPFSGRPGARLYRTGDRARLRPDGNVEFSGRRDDQVKLRGYRIELGEIEAALTSHPQVKEAAVIVHQEDPLDRRLVAYLTIREEAPAHGELRRLLGERLPAYMVPSSFLVLDALPRTPNGKIDRRRLPAPDHRRPDLEQAFAAPRNETERRVATVWSEVLGIEQVGIHDSFFDLGGQSLLLARAHARLRQQPGGERLALIDLFRHPTVAALAQHWAAAGGEASGRERSAPAVEEQISRLQEGRRRQQAVRELRQRAGGGGGPGHE